MELEHFEADITEDAREGMLFEKVWHQWRALSRPQKSRNEVEDGPRQDPMNHHLFLQQVVNMSPKAGENRQLLSLALQCDQELSKMPPEILDLVLQGVDVERNNLLDMEDPHLTVFRTFVDVRRKLLTIQPLNESEMSEHSVELTDEDVQIIEDGRRKLKEKKSS